MSANAAKTMAEQETDQTELKTVQNEETVHAENSPESEVGFELNEPRWSVVTFEKCAAKNLTYEQAFQKMQELNAQNFSGLCIVTDEAAERISKK